MTDVSIKKMEKVYDPATINPIVSKKDNRINLRLDDEELGSLEELIVKVRSKNPYVPKTILIKELIGFRPPEFFTESDRRSLREDHKHRQSGKKEHQQIERKK